MNLWIDTLVIFIGLLALRFVLLRLGKSIQVNPPVIWSAIFVVSLMGIIPIVLIKKEIIENSVPNIVLAGFIFFYIPFLVSRVEREAKAVRSN